MFEGLAPRIVEIADASAEEVRLFSSLTEAQLRNGFEADAGLFIAESPKVIDVALRSGYEPIALLTEWHHVRGIAADVINRVGNIPIYVGQREVLRSITGYTLSRGVLCAMRRKPLPSLGDICAEGHRLLVLDGVVDAVNVGAATRSAAALNMDALLFTSTTCEPLNRRVIRVSMGTIFQMPWTRLGTGEWPASAMTQLRSMGYKLVAMALDDRALPFDDSRLAAEPRLAIVMGAEGDGLSRSVIEQCDYVARIPMRAGVDSLNVAAAAALACWQMRWR
ncbi:MAG: RNA methyltransferase [Bacteroidales bacterium]|nr:RNA methyltransferase [Bacteroidales bacterium]